jgi:hypothetical protein
MLNAHKTAMFLPLLSVPVEGDGGDAGRNGAGEVGLVQLVASRQGESSLASTVLSTPSSDLSLVGFCSFGLVAMYVSGSGLANSLTARSIPRRCN